MFLDNVNILGFKFSVDSVSELLSQINSIKKDGEIIQLLNADSIVSKNQIYHAVNQAFLAFNRGENLAKDIDLIEYHVDAITGGTDAFIDVIIKLQKDDKVVSARGTESDIINASVKAYIAGVNRLLGD